MLTKEDFFTSLTTTEGVMHAMRVVINAPIKPPCPAKTVQSAGIISEMMTRMARLPIGDRKLTTKQLEYAHDMLRRDLADHIIGVINSVESVTTFTEQAVVAEVARQEAIYSDNPLWGSF